MRLLTSYHVISMCSLCLRNDDYLREDDYDVKAAVDETLRERGFAVEEDDRMDVS